MKDLTDTISRRNIMQGAGLVSAAALLDAAPGLAAARKKTPRTLALIGDRFHNSDYIRVALTKTFGELSMPIDLTIDYGGISAKLLKHYDVLLILRDGMIWPNGYGAPRRPGNGAANPAGAPATPAAAPDPAAPAAPGGGFAGSATWITPAQGKAIKDFVNRGGGLYSMHNSSNISAFSQDYRDVMGGLFLGHPEVRQFQLRPTANKHPITDGIEPFMVTDEQHFVTYDKDPKYQILVSENLDGLKYRDLGTTAVGGWAYDYGKGRVVFTAAGHNIETLWNPQYSEIQKRSMHWLLKQI